jgi:hypothetical protein
VLDNDNVRARFKVDRVWKGKVPREVSMRSPAELDVDGTVTTNTCEIDFPPGEAFLVFAYGAPTEPMRAPRCSYTSALAGASATIERLDAIVRERAR